MPNITAVRGYLINFDILVNINGFRIELCGFQVIPRKEVSTTSGSIPTTFRSIWHYLSKSILAIWSTLLTSWSTFVVSRSSSIASRLKMQVHTRNLNRYFIDPCECVPGMHNHTGRLCVCCQVLLRISHFRGRFLGQESISCLFVCPFPPHTTRQHHLTW